MKGFVADGERAVAVLDADERTVIARMVADVGLLLGGDVFGLEQEQMPEPADDDILRHLRGFEESLSAPDDPAVLRLLPQASPDREVADEFRRLTEADLRDVKVRRLRRVWEQLSEEGPEWSVPLAEALDVAAALTDVRLVIATRLGIETDDDAERLATELRLVEHAIETDADEQLGIDPARMWLGMLTSALAWLQESLIRVVAEPSAK